MRKLEYYKWKKVICLVLVCKKCGKAPFSPNEYVTHFSTKTEGYELLEDEAGEDYNVPNCGCWK